MDWDIIFQQRIQVTLKLLHQLDSVRALYWKQQVWCVSITNAVDGSYMFEPESKYINEMEANIKTGNF